MKRLLLVGVVILLFTATIPALAQETLEYGQIITAEITNESYAQQYVFEGAAGDAIIIEMKGIDPLDGFDSPQLSIQDPDHYVLTDTENMFQFVGGWGEELIAIELPADGTYTIIATRTDGKDGDSVGEYTLQIIEATPMESGKPYTGTVSSEDGGFHYYVYSGTEQFSLMYERLAGEYAPEVGVYILDGGELTNIGSVAGDELTKGTLGVFRGNRAYFILVGETTSFIGGGYYFSGETADYQLTLEFE